MRTQPNRAALLAAALLPAALLPALVLTALVLIVVSCGGRTRWDNPQCQGPDLLVSPLAGWEAILTEGTCSFEEEQAGHRHRVVCDGETCLWFVNGALGCRCQQLDYANVCSNGVPMCAEWREHFDFSGPPLMTELGGRDPRSVSVVSEPQIFQHCPFSTARAAWTTF